MRDSQKNKINSAFISMYEVMAGDLVTWYASPTASGIDLLTIQWQSEQTGVDVSKAGVWDKAEYELLFLKWYLDHKGVVLTPTGYFGLNGVRYNFKDDAPIVDTQVPIDGIHNIITCKIVKAEALQNTPEATTSGTWTIGDQSWTIS